MAQDGRTALMDAAQFKHASIVSLLAAAGGIYREDTVSAHCIWKLSISFEKAVRQSLYSHRFA